MMSMSVKERDMMLGRAEDAILERAVQPKSAAELVQELRREGIDEYFVRAGIWFLMDRGYVMLNPERKVVVTSARDRG